MGNFMMEFLYKLYKWSEYKFLIVAIFASMAGILGFYTYAHIYKIGWEKSLLYTVELFAMDMKHPAEVKELIWLENSNSKEFVNDNGEINASYSSIECGETFVCSLLGHNWKLIYVAALIGTFTLVLGVFLLFFRHQLSVLYRYSMIKRGKHTIVLGLGKNSRFFINSMLKKYPHRLLVFETDKENPYLEHYRDRRISLVVEDVDHVIEKLNLKSCQNIFISTGDDERNIYYALQFLERFEVIDSPKKKSILNRLLVHVEDRTLRNFYSDEGVLHNCGIDMKVFSFYKESARMFFQENSLEGNDISFIQKKQPFSIYIIGDSELSISLVVEAYKLAHYPEKNELTIKVIAKETSELQKKIEHAFPEMKEIKNIHLEFKNKDSDTIKFYTTAELWKDVSQLKHVFFCYDDVSENIKMATKVADVTFLRRRDEYKNIQFHIATMNHIRIAKEIRFSLRENVSVFARAEHVCSYENFLDNNIDKIAKLINYDHYQGNGKEEYTQEQQARIHNAEDLWKETLINDKKSSIGQAIHIRTKLNYLGLDVKKREKKEILELKEINKKLVESVVLFKSNFVEELNKLTCCEHQRWMALLRLMDYKYADIEFKDKQQKYHPLLKPWSEFSKDEKKAYAQYDINAILKIAEYEAEVGNCIYEKLNDTNL